VSKSYARRMQRVQPSAIRELLHLGADPSLISFGGGYPDPALFPVAELAEVYAELLVPERVDSLQYTASVGLSLLREQVAERLSRDGIASTAADVLIIQGAQQGLDLAARMMIDPGDVVITENPTFLGALIAFNPYEPAYATVCSDGDGMDTDDLEQVLAAEPGTKLIYVMPDFANPTGTTMSLPRRQRLVELANEHDVMIIEDTPYRPLRYSGDHLPTVKSMDTEGRVLHLGSFSKILAPGMGSAGRSQQRAFWSG
jgi:2-aminoadipate transaminase